MTVEDDLHRGYDAGNYAGAYSSTTDFDNAWKAENWPHGRSTAFRAAFILGFFSSFADEEVDEEYLDELLATRDEWTVRLRAVGIAVRDDDVDA